jgi:hypothetical protein
METHFDVHSKLMYGLVVILVALLAHYAVTVAQYKSADRNKSDKKRPPVAPHFLPFFGSIR